MTSPAQVSDVVKRIAVMPLPDWAGLSEEAKAAYLSLQEALRSLAPADDAAVSRWASRLAGAPLDRLPRLVELEHRLSPQMLARSPIDRLEPRTPTEIRASATIATLVHKGLDAESSRFAEALIAAHQAGSDLPGGIRTGGVRSLPDRLGSYVVFPEPEFVAPGLVRLHEFINQTLEFCPAFVASVAMTALCNLHPFTDGNGRLSRLVFNALVTRREEDRLSYLPLHELGRISRGGFLIAMRLAQYRGEWSTLARFLEASAVATRSILDSNRP